MFVQKAQVFFKTLFFISYRNVCLFFISLLLVSCSLNQNDYLVRNLKTNKEQQNQLIFLLSEKPTDNETRFTLINGIANNLLTENCTSELIYFLSSTIENTPDDPYNAYWLLLLAHAYLEQGGANAARYYFERILNKYPDLKIQGYSIHLISLQNLIKITENPALLVEYYSQLITQFGDQISLAETYFMLARSYEKLGEWELAIQTYAEFLDYGKYDAIIPGVPAAYEYAKSIVDYNSSQKDWTFETLDDLVTAIKKAIDTYDYRALERYRAKVNFFAMSWKQESNDTSSQADFSMRDFMVGNRIKYAETIDASSSPTEAYFRTSGWSQYVTIWYLYFRKVNFPADPDIHGRWEWAGIYYGEKM